MRLKKPTETDLVYQVLDYLRLRGILAWRNNSGMAMGASGTRVKIGLAGSSDILGMMPGGRFLAIECKMPKGKLSDKQFTFLAAVNRGGGVGLLVRDIPTLQMYLRLASDGARFAVTTDGQMRVLEAKRV